MRTSKLARGATAGLLLLGTSSACRSSTPQKSPAATPTSAKAPAAAAPVEQVDPEEVIEQASIAFGRELAEVYQEARQRVAPAGGLVRYAGDLSDFMQIAATLPAADVGFRSFEYQLDCDVTEPPPICAVARAFSAAEVKAAKERLAVLDNVSPLELRFVGRADPVWKAPSVERIYGGECGEHQCDTGSGKISVRAGMAVDSNQVLSCLRAMCLMAESNLDPEDLDIRVRGMVTEEDTPETGRRAEVALSAKLSRRVHKVFWRTFLRAVGHRG